MRARRAGRGAAASAAALAALLALAACAQPATAPGPFSVPPAIAEQRMAFAVESVCVQNRTASAQRAAARRLGFANSASRGGETTYLNPATGTILVIGPVPGTSITVEGGTRTIPAGSGCWTGSPSLTIMATNRIASRLVASRLVEANALTRAPVAAGENESGGIGLFFERLAVTVIDVTTQLTDTAAGAEAEPLVLRYPAILIRHS